MQRGDPGAVQQDGIHSGSTLGCHLELLDSLCTQVIFITLPIPCLSFPSEAVVGLGDLQGKSYLLLPRPLQ